MTKNNLPDHLDWLRKNPGCVKPVFKTQYSPPTASDLTNPAKSQTSALSPAGAAGHSGPKFTLPNPQPQPQPQPPPQLQPYVARQPPLQQQQQQRQQQQSQPAPALAIQPQPPQENFEIYDDDIDDDELYMMPSLPTRLSPRKSQNRSLPPVPSLPRSKSDITGVTNSKPALYASTSVMGRFERAYASQAASLKVEASSAVPPKSESTNSFSNSSRNQQPPQNDVAPMDLDDTPIYSPDEFDIKDSHVQLCDKSATSKLESLPSVANKRKSDDISKMICDSEDDDEFIDVHELLAGNTPLSTRKPISTLSSGETPSSKTAWSSQESASKPRSGKRPKLLQCQQEPTTPPPAPAPKAKARPTLFESPPRIEMPTPRNQAASAGIMSTPIEIADDDLLELAEAEAFSQVARERSIHDVVQDSEEECSSPIQMSHFPPTTFTKSDVPPSDSTVKREPPAAVSLNDSQPSDPTPAAIPSTASPWSSVPAPPLPPPALPEVISVDPHKLSPATRGDQSAALLILKNPVLMRLKQEAIELQRAKNHKDFEASLRSRGPDAKELRDRAKAERFDLNTQAKDVEDLVGILSRQKALCDDTEHLMQQISEAYRQGIATDDDEVRLDELGEHVKAVEAEFCTAFERSRVTEAEIMELYAQHLRDTVVASTVPPSPELDVPEVPATANSSGLPSANPTRAVSRPVPADPSFSDDIDDDILMQLHTSSRPPPISKPSFEQNHTSGTSQSMVQTMLSFEQQDSGSSRQPQLPRYNAAPAAKQPDYYEVDDGFVDDGFLVAAAESFDATQFANSSRPAPVSVASKLPAKQAPVKPPPKKAERPKNPWPPELMRHPWSAEVKQMLKDRFRLHSFRHNQLEAINATLAGKDAFVLMPTGGGKSLCYQLPAVVRSGKTRGITLVISPLLSLMNDQVEHLKALGILAVKYNGEMTLDAKQMVLTMFDELNPEDFIEILYTTPEMLNKSDKFVNAMKKLYKRNKLARIVIDEAHCVSQWGHDFRPDYKEIGKIRPNFPGIPMMALTATATSGVIMDIKHNLSLENCETFAQSFNRTNLYYEVRRKKPRLAFEEVKQLILEHKGQSGIVYTLSRKNSEEVAAKLNDANISAARYHADVPPDEKLQIQQKWQSNEIQVVVATIAFGMGIDKPDVRFVIHFSIPKSLEGYYQETGRAGRDGLPSKCYCFYGKGDVVMLRKMISGEMIGKGGRQVARANQPSQEQIDRQIAMLNRVAAFCDNESDCRRVEILRYFGESFTPSQCGRNCDNCFLDKQVSAPRDFSAIAKAALGLLRLHPGRMTLGQCADVLMGRGNKTLEKINACEEAYQLSGQAEGTPKLHIERVIGQLERDNAVVSEQWMNHKVGFAIDYIKCGPEAPAFLSGRRRLMLSVRLDDGTGPKPKTKKKKEPTSTMVSSPVRGRKKNTAPVTIDSDDSFFESENDGDVVDVDDEVYDENYDEDYEEDAFDPPGPAASMPTASSRRQSQQTTLTAQPKPKPKSMVNSIHKSVIENFIVEAQNLEENMRNAQGLRKPLFSRSDFQQMATLWTTTPAAMSKIPGIDVARVRSHGERFLQLVRTFRNQYDSMMGGAALGGDGMVVDLVSDDDDYEDDNEEEDSKFFQTTTAEATPQPVAGRFNHFAAGASANQSTNQPTQRNPLVTQWHQQLETLDRAPPSNNSRSNSRSGGGSSRATSTNYYSSRGGGRRQFSRGRSGGGSRSNHANGSGGGGGGSGSGRSFGRRGGGGGNTSMGGGSGGGVSKARNAGRKGGGGGAGSAGSRSGRGGRSGGGGGSGILPMPM